MPTWTIAIATQARRLDKFEELMKVLLPQVQEARGDAEVVALWNNCEKPIHMYRQALLDDARGQYFSCVDDDDMVEADFVPVVLEAMHDSPGVDYIAFRHGYYEGGVFDRPSITGLNIGPPRNMPEAYYRPVSHINPARTELARQAGFLAPPGMWEDFAYDRAMEKLLKTEAVIDRMLYHYYHDFRDSVQHGVRPLFTVPRRPSPPIPAFRWHPWSI